MQERSTVRARWLRGALLTLCVIGCSEAGKEEAAPADPPGTFSFGLFGDGPYIGWQTGRWKAVIAEANASGIRWFLHVGDILGRACDDASYAERLAELNSIRHPVIYTPGDNEWTDCYLKGSGGFDPLERLQTLRSMYFARPGVTLGARQMLVDSQGADAAFAQYVENVRWSYGGLLFLTVHIVGSRNGAEPFGARKREHDVETQRRTRAAMAWMEEGFRKLESDNMRGIVIAMHGNPGLHERRVRGEGYDDLMDRMEQLVGATDKPVLLIHGDSHHQRMDHPLVDGASGQPFANFTRLETFGAPDIGWVRVVMDSAEGRVKSIEPRLLSPWHF